MINVQEWLDNNYPKEERKNITQLTLAINKVKELEGSLNLNDFVNLKWLFCKFSKITSLDISDCERIAGLDLCKSQLTDDTLFLPKETTRLKVLNVWGNKFSDLSFFSRFTNLETVWLNDNQFSGSLEPLRGWWKLGELHIEETNIDSGLEYLPDTLEKIYCDGKIAQQLKDYKKKYYYDYQSWREDHKELVAKIEISPKTNS